MTKRIRQPKINRIAGSEIQLCESFIKVAKYHSWVVYPEVNDWDIVCVKDDITVGIQAKMHPNIDVLYQSIIPVVNHNPHYRCVLVPKCNRKFVAVAIKLGVEVIALNNLTYRPDPIRLTYNWNPKKQMWLPPVPSETKAGTPCPSSLTQWRVDAIRLCLLLEKNGYLTGLDFKRAGINKQRWVDNGWLRRKGSIGRYAKYIQGHSDLPIVGFESEAAKIKALDDSKEN